LDTVSNRAAVDHLTDEVIFAGLIEVKACRLVVPFSEILVFTGPESKAIIFEIKGQLGPFDPLAGELGRRLRAVVSAGIPRLTELFLAEFIAADGTRFRGWAGILPIEWTEVESVCCAISIRIGLADAAIGAAGESRQAVGIVITRGTVPAGRASVGRIKGATVVLVRNAVVVVVSIEAVGRAVPVAIGCTDFPGTVTGETLVTVLVGAAEGTELSNGTTVGPI
jgi:hypothetical protein